MHSSAQELPLLVKWEDFLAWLFPVLEKIPKSARFTFAQRVQSHGLDVMELLMDARFGRSRVAKLRTANQALDRMRVLLRLAHRLRLIAPGAYRHGSEAIDECGRMIGGWLRHESGVVRTDVPNEAAAACGA